MYVAFLNIKAGASPELRPLPSGLTSFSRCNGGQNLHRSLRAIYVLSVLSRQPPLFKDSHHGAPQITGSHPGISSCDFWDYPLKLLSPTCWWTPHSFPLRSLLPSFSALVGVSSTSWLLPAGLQALGLLSLWIKELGVSNRDTRGLMGRGSLPV